MLCLAELFLQQGFYGPKVLRRLRQTNQHERPTLPALRLDHALGSPRNQDRRAFGNFSHTDLPELLCVMTAPRDLARGLDTGKCSWRWNAVQTVANKLVPARWNARTVES